MMIPAKSGNRRVSTWIILKIFKSEHKNWNNLSTYKTVDFNPKHLDIKGYFDMHFDFQIIK